MNWSSILSTLVGKCVCESELWKEWRKKVSGTEKKKVVGQECHKVIKLDAGVSGNRIYIFSLWRYIYVCMYVYTFLCIYINLYISYISNLSTQNTYYTHSEKSWVEMAV